MDEDNTEEQYKNTNKKQVEWLAPYQFKPGQSGNPGGRPKGSSLKVWVQNMLLGMTDEERLEFLIGINKVDIWKMAEGNPQNDITSSGLPIVQNEIVIKNFGS